MTDDPRHFCINCGHTEGLHIHRDNGTRGRCMAASGCECRIYSPVMPQSVTLPGPIRMCAACCHTAHPGERCKFTQEKPGEVYECPCTSPTISEEAIARHQPDPLAEEWRQHWTAYLRKEQEEIAKFVPASDIPALCRWCGKYEAKRGSEFCAGCHQEENASDRQVCRCGHRRGEHAVIAALNLAEACEGGCVWQIPNRFQDMTPQQQELLEREDDD